MGLWKIDNPGLEIGHKLCSHRRVPVLYLRSAFALLTSTSSQHFQGGKIMSKVSYIPKDYNSVTPYLIVKGAAQAIEYYKKVFGATETVRMNGPDGKVGHAELKIGDSHIMLADENPSMGEGHTSATTVGGSPVSLYVYLPDVDSVVKKAAAEGAKILKPVQDQFYGDRNGFIRDPFGHLWGIATHVEDVSPSEMAERMKKMMPAA
jgi:PhnB protein